MSTNVRYWSADKHILPTYTNNHSPCINNVAILLITSFFVALFIQNVSVSIDTTLRQEFLGQIAHGQSLSRVNQCSGLGVGFGGQVFGDLSQFSKHEAEYYAASVTWNVCQTQTIHFVILSEAA
jgi:hypothetical protein